MTTMTTLSPFCTPVPTHRTQGVPPGAPTVSPDQPVRPRNSPPRQEALKVDDRIVQAGRKQMLKIVDRLGLQRETSPYDPFRALTVHIESGTQKNYQLRWKEMMKFFYLIGDYQSAMLVDRLYCPKKPLPFRPESFAMYLDFRCGKAGTMLKKPGGETALDTDGKEVIVLGGWCSPSSLYTVHAAVRFLHEVAYPSTCGGMYFSSCEQCEAVNRSLGSQLQGVQEGDDDEDDDELEEEERERRAQEAVNRSHGLFRSCIEHANQPLLRSRGCVTRNPATESHYMSLMKYIQKVHVTRGCGQLQPAEVRLIRGYLLARGDCVSLQTWIMFLLGIKLFLRADEVCKLEVRDFIHSFYPEGKDVLKEPKPAGVRALTKCQIVSSKAVEALACEVKGKSDQKPVRLALFADNEFPEFCPVRHLLWYMRLFNIHGGYLFPNSTELIRQWNAGCVPELNGSTHVTYGSYLTVMKFLVSNVCRRDTKEFVVGTHTMRKTAYLFAVWGFHTGERLAAYGDNSLAMANVMKSARHVSVQHASTYQRDASTQFEIARRQEDNSQNLIGVFQSIYMDIGAHGSSINPSTPYQKDLPLLAIEWYDNILGLKGRSMVERPVEVLNLAVKQVPVASELGELKTLVEKITKNHHDVNNLMRAFTAILAKKDKEVGARVQEQLESTRALGNGSVAMPLVVTRKSTAGTSVKYALSTKNYKGLVGVAKIDFFLGRQAEMMEQCGGKRTKMSDKDRRWYSRHVDPPLKCLHECLKGDKHRFLEIYGDKFKTAGWKCKCC